MEREHADAVIARWCRKRAAKALMARWWRGVRQCDRCGTKFPRKGIRRFCSRRCQTLHISAVRVGQPAAIGSRLCLYCGVAMSGVRLRKYCDRLCASRARYCRRKGLPKPTQLKRDSNREIIASGWIPTSAAILRWRELQEHGKCAVCCEPARVLLNGRTVLTCGRRECKNELGKDRRREAYALRKAAGTL